MLDLICMGPVDLPGARRKRQNTKLNILSNNGTRTHNLEISSLTLYRLSYPGFDESCPIKVTFKHEYSSDTNVYIGINKFENEEVERIFSCTCTVLCYILEYIYIRQIAKRHTSPVLTFNTQNKTKHSTWSGRVFGLVLHVGSQHWWSVWYCFACWKQTQDLCVSLHFTQYRYIPICNTKQYI